MLLNICRQTFYISLVRISQKVKGVLMRNLQHIIFIWRRWYCDFQISLRVFDNWRTPNFDGVCMILDMRTFRHTHFFPEIFQLSKFVFLMILYCLKLTAIYLTLNYLFVLERDRFFTVYICLKETLFFIQIISKYYLCFYYKIMKKPYMRTIIGSFGRGCILSFSTL